MGKFILNKERLFDENLVISDIGRNKLGVEIYKPKRAKKKK